MAEEPVVPIDTPLNAEDSKLLKDLDSGQVSVPVSDTSNISKPKIQKVPEFMLRQEDLKKYYAPSEIAIGPLHANSDKLKKEELKVKFTRKFIERSGKTGEILLKEIKENINQIKQSFDEILINDIPDDRLARMLLLDGCSVLEFISSYLCGDLTHFEITNGQAALIEQDLFLLENQIPFRVLALLTKLGSERENRLTLNEEGFMLQIYRFILKGFMLPVPRWGWNLFRILRKLEPGEPVHLLDFLREILILDIGPGLYSRQNNDHFSRLSFRNVQDLKKAGVKFMPSYSHSLRSVSFSSRCFIAGQLKLPQLTVNASTAPKLLNLAAYEMCFANYRYNNEVTSYLSFLDSLIDSEEDVRDLRHAHIIQNHLSSDAEVAQLFNSMGKSLVVHDAYLDVKNKIQKHYERRPSFWIAQVCRDHFRSPWAILALLAATTILLLTAIQTYYAIHPRK